jgi:hypothetical protein
MLLFITIGLITFFIFHQAYKMIEARRSRLATQSSTTLEEKSSRETQRFKQPHPLGLREQRPRPRPLPARQMTHQGIPQPLQRAAAPAMSAEATQRAEREQLAARERMNRIYEEQALEQARSQVSITMYMADW